MGSTNSNFCQCKNLVDESCIKTFSFEDIKNMICPQTNPTIPSKKERHSFNKKKRFRYYQKKN